MIPSLYTPYLQIPVKPLYDAIVKGLISWGIRP